MDATEPAADATALIHALTERGLTLATAESLTGGMVCARLTDVPGSSAVVRGGVVSYATDIKASVLGVDHTRLDETGPVDEVVSLQMARGVRALMGADIGLATTGVAGPGPADGHPAGTVHIACAWDGGTAHRLLALSGDRDDVRRLTVDAVLRLVSDSLPR